MMNDALLVKLGGTSINEIIERTTLLPTDGTARNLLYSYTRIRIFHRKTNVKFALLNITKL